jgi:hypothetical protein
MKSRATLICVFHADDVYDPDIIIKEVQTMQMYKDAGAVFTLRRLIDEKGELLGKVPLPFNFTGKHIIAGKATLFPIMLHCLNKFERKCNIYKCPF